MSVAVLLLPPMSSRLWTITTLHLTLTNSQGNSFAIASKNSTVIIAHGFGSRNCQPPVKWLRIEPPFQWRSWLRHCATRRKVAGSIPDGVIGLFH
jgi:hypothetical protein